MIGKLLIGGLAVLALAMCMALPNNPNSPKPVGIAAVLTSSEQATLDAATKHNADVMSHYESTDPQSDDNVEYNSLAILAAQDYVKQVLRDPGSAVFSNQHWINAGATNLVCGQVNAKNGFGGYTGYESYAVPLSGSHAGQVIIGLNSHTAKLCSSSGTRFVVL